MHELRLETKAPSGRGSSSSVHGVQQKWFDINHRCHCKLDSIGYHEGLVECIISNVLNHVTLNGEAFPYVEYWLEDLNGSTVTVSKSFLEKGERELSLESIIKFNNELAVLNEDSSIPVDIRLATIIQDIATQFQLTQLPMQYGATMLLDQLFLNEDRHWGNSAIIRSTDGYRIAPMYDNGRALRVSFDKLDNVWSFFEPNPYNGDQLDAIPKLLGCCRVNLNRSRIDMDMLRLSLYPFYAEAIVDGYLMVLDRLLSSCEYMRFAEYLEVH